MNSINNHSKRKAIPPWLAPKTLLTAGTSIGLLVIPIIIDSQTPRVISISFTDVSQSNQEYKTSVRQVRLDIWCNLSPGTIKALPADIQKEGTKQARKAINSD